MQHNGPHQKNVTQRTEDRRKYTGMEEMLETTDYLPL